MQTFLFVPAARDEIFEKAFKSGASDIIFDLEDALSEEQKLIGRENILKFSKQRNDFTVRINDAQSKFFDDDIKLLNSLNDLKQIILTKVTSKDDILNLRQKLNKDIEIIAMIEDAKGILNLSEISSCPGVCQLSYGALDIMVDLNLTYEGLKIVSENLQLKMVLYSKAANLKAPIQTVFADFKNSEGFVKHYLFAKNLGFGGILCIHPNQVKLVNDDNSQDEIKWAQEVIKLAEIHKNEVFKLNGQMVDLPVIKRAKKILEK